MQRVDYERPADIPAALRGGATAGAAYYAGGTTLLDLMKLDIETPQTLVDINHLPLGGIEMRDGTLRFGALTRMSDAADHPDVGTHAPAIAAALLVSASAQLRNMATLGGNLLQRTRCMMFPPVVALLRSCVLAPDSSACDNTG